MKKISFEKIWEIFQKKRSVRVLGILNIIFILLTIAFLFFIYHYQEKTDKQETAIAKHQQTLTTLQSIAESAKEEKITQEDKIYSEKKFANYDEVIPFITLLENLFSAIDPEAEITIKSQEDQIFIDHFADYKVYLKLNGNKEIFFKALDELYKRPIITKIINFTLHYKPVANTEMNELSEIEMVIRLYLV